MLYFRSHKHLEMTATVKIMYQLTNVANLENKYIITINSSVKELHELVNSSQHLLPGEIQQRNHSEAELLQEVGQLMHIHNGGH